MAKKGASPQAADEKGGVPTRRTCGTMEVHNRLLRTMPGYREAREAIENHAWRTALSPLLARAGCTKIPVVVHVVHKTDAQNISDAQITSQIDVLNADFRKTNADIASVPAAFQPLTADARIQFELATVDPNGNPTNGITRTRTTVDAFSDDDAVKSAGSGGADAWPRDKYLNIWVCQLGGGLLGYAQFPGGPAATDGVVILHSAFGTSGTATAPFNLGRTTTHEVGHWLNLRHIWGDDGNGCSGSDFVADTPNQAGPNYGTPAFPSITCSNGPNGDLFMNYMDYTDDVAMFMFTTGQVARMQATLDGSRSMIGVPVPCGKSTLKEHPKDPIKELPKEIPKDMPKEGVKEHPKDVIKEHPKEGVKDAPKELPKEIPKDVAKDLPKDPPKEAIFEGNKFFVNDLPPKAIFDPPKFAFEPPGDLTGFPFAPSNPAFGFGFGFGGGGIPFVLGTPFLGWGRSGGGCGCKEGAGQQNAALAAAYVPILAQYARLYSQGMLDPAGMGAWQQCAAAYRQLAGSGGGQSSPY